MADIVKFKSGNLNKIATTTTPIEAGTVYFAIDGDNSYGSIYFDKDSSHRIKMGEHHADIADSAIKDGSGNNIAATYLKEISWVNDGQKVRQTKGSGSYTDLVAPWLLLTGGAVTGPVSFGDAVTIDDLTAGSALINGTLRVVNGITGNLTGNVVGNVTGNLIGLASKATADANNQNIASTYIKGLTASGTTITYTRGDGSTGTITTQDIDNDIKVNMVARGTTKAYLLGTITSPTGTAQAVTSVAETGVYFDTVAGKVVATTFKGALEGNASTATKATQDSSGQQINTTYLKNWSTTPTIITLTKGDGSTSTINSPWLPLIGGTVTGPVIFGDSVTLDSFTSEAGVINGNLSVAGMIYGNVTGNLTGNATSATSATKDGVGQIIADTYISKTIGTAKGDIIYWSASGTPVRLAAGTDGKVLKMSGGVPIWDNDVDVDIKVKLISTSTSGDYPLMFGPTTASSGSSYEAYYNSGIKVNPSTATITAANFAGTANRANADGAGNNIQDTYVNKSGDTMTGQLTMKSHIVLEKPNNVTWSASGGGDEPSIQMIGANNRAFKFRFSSNGQNVDVGYDWPARDGSGAAFRSVDAGGVVIFYARNASQTSQLYCYPNGVLRWEELGVNRRVATATDGEAVGSTTKPVYIDASGHIQPITSYEGTATKAIQDSSGQNIATTYLKDWSTTDAVITLTKGDGSTSTINSPWLPLTGGQVTGPVSFGDTVNIDDLTASSAIINGHLTVVNGITGNLTGNVIGDITGNLTGTASRATADSSGQSIVDTYLKSVDYDSTNFKFTKTKGGGSTSDIVSIAAMLGFASRQSSAGWGNTTGTTILTMNDSTGGSIDIRRDNPSSGKLSIKVDGRFYFNEGTTPAAGLKSTNGYWGMTGPDGEDNIWIRTTTQGIIPYQSGNAGSGHGYLGTDSWYFAHAYIDHIHGLADKTTSDASGQTITTTYLKNWSTTPTVITLTKGDGSTSTISSPWLPLIGGTVTGPVIFGDSVTLDSFNAEAGVINGNLSVAGMIYGNITGNLTGNATTATTATKDSTGLVISDSYVHKSGDTMTGELTVPYIHATRTTNHGLQVGTIRGKAVGSLIGEYIHMYERVHIGYPNGWGGQDAPSYGLSTYGGVDLGTNTGGVTIAKNKGVDNTAFKNRLVLYTNESNESTQENFDASKATWGIGFHRDWNTSNKGSDSEAGIYAVGSSGWRTGLVFRVKNTGTQGAAHDTTAMWMSPKGIIGIGTVTPDTNSKMHIYGSFGDSHGLLKLEDTRTDSGWHYPLLGLSPSIANGGNIYICIGQAANTGNSAGLRYQWNGTNNNASLMGFEFYGKGTPFYVRNDSLAYFSNSVTIADTIQSGYKLLVNGQSNFKDQLIIWNNNNSRGDLYSGSIQLREFGSQTTSCTQNLYNAPGITFHWGGRWVHKLNLQNDKLNWDNTVIPNTNNTTGTVGNATVPVYSNGGVITAINTGTANYTKSITVTGDLDTYYPVVISATTDKTKPHIISIWKNLGSTTAAYSSGNHSSGSSSMWLMYEYRNVYWDGNGGYYKTWYYSMPYANLVAKSQALGSGVGNLCIWLRGGTTLYNISSDYDFTVTIYYTATNVGSSDYPVNIEPTTTVTSGGWKLISTLGYGNIDGNATTATNADKVDNYHASDLWRKDGGVWNPGANITLGATGNNQEWSFDISRNGYTGTYWHVWDSALGTMLKVNADDGKVSAPYGFIGNLTGNADTATIASNNIKVQTSAPTGDSRTLWVDTSAGADLAVLKYWTGSAWKTIKSVWA